MKKYLLTLHRQPDQHKKRFALTVSSIVTLFIFGVWSLVTFGVHPEIVAQKNEASPLDSLRTSVASSFEALTNSLEALTKNLGSVNFEAGYKDMRDKAIDTYGK